MPGMRACSAAGHPAYAEPGKAGTTAPQGRDALSDQGLPVTNGITTMTPEDHLGLDQRARVMVKSSAASDVGTLISQVLSVCCAWARSLHSGESRMGLKQSPAVCGPRLRQGDEVLESSPEQARAAVLVSHC